VVLPKAEFRLLLVLRRDIVQSFPCTATIFWSTASPHLSFIPGSSSSALTAAETFSSEAGSLREMFFNLADVISLSYSAGSLTRCKILRNCGFTFPPKECVLRTFIALKNPPSSAGFEPAGLGSNCNHAKHYATWVEQHLCWWEDMRCNRNTIRTNLMKVCQYVVIILMSVTVGSHRHNHYVKWLPEPYKLK
jgi:hypothetical protein